MDHAQPTDVPRAASTPEAQPAAIGPRPWARAAAVAVFILTCASVWGALAAHAAGSPPSTAVARE